LQSVLSTIASCDPVGLVSETQATSIDSLAKKVVHFVQKEDWLSALEKRNELFEFFWNATGGVNVYDVRKGDVQSDWSLLQKFLNLAETKLALNVDEGVSFLNDPYVYLALKVGKSYCIVDKLLFSITACFAVRYYEIDNASLPNTN